MVAIDVMLQSHQLLKTVRSLHLYVGVFMAPALLFFAVTGGLQAFGLHESARGSSYVPPAWLVSLSHLHKKQSLESPSGKRRPPKARPKAPVDAAPVPAPPAAAAPGKRTVAAPMPLPARHRNLLPMKIFFALVALSLIASTLGGLYMAYRFKRNARVVSGVLLAGVVVPLLLLLF